MSWLREREGVGKFCDGLGFGESTWVWLGFGRFGWGDRFCLTLGKLAD